jgi:hypothetical protein
MCCEIVTTIVFALMFVLIGSQSDDQESPSRSYLADVTLIGVDAAAAGTFAANQMANIDRLRASPLGKQIMK